MTDGDQVSELRRAFLPGNILSYSTTRINVKCNGHEIGRATGFVGRFSDRYALVTNWHVVSGYNPNTGKLISKVSAIPDEIEFHVAVLHPASVENGSSVRNVFFKPLSVKLFNGERKNWIENVDGDVIQDVAIIPLRDHVEELSEIGTELLSIQCGNMSIYWDQKTNTWGDSAKPFYPPIGHDVFILGYPQGIDTTGILPVWKRGSVASEPLYPLTINGANLGTLFYIDALTKHGMSGAPVLCRVKAGDKFYTTDAEPITFQRDETFLAGVYAGRDGLSQQEFEFSVGRVWKLEVVSALFFKSYEVE
ncbi:MAG: trypsin-like peptidase domain-containing protein [Rhizobium sp.]|nr:trypsin-like peptidase domain-containing protein [Rhizobium sp.]